MKEMLCQQIDLPDGKTVLPAFLEIERKSW